jgi:hypothetical protein
MTAEIFQRGFIEVSKESIAPQNRNEKLKFNTSIKRSRVEGKFIAFRYQIG